MIEQLGWGLPALITVAAGVFVLVLAQTRATGTARTCGVIGAVLIMAGAVIPAIFGMAVLSRMSYENLTATYTMVLIENSIRVLLAGAGLLMLVRCVVLSRRPTGENPAWPGNQPNPTPYQPGYPPAQPNPYGQDPRL